MTMHYQDSDPILLGSGELYICLSKDIQNLEELTTQEEEALINIGAIQSGATIEIGTEAVDLNSANRGLIKRVPIKKNIRFSTGIMSWMLENITKFLTGSQVDVDATTGTKKTKINLKDETPEVYLRFVHDKKEGGQLIVNIYKAMFDGSLNFVFDSENPTTFNYDFVGLANKNLNYVEIIETFED